jgi:hypothetical protein
VPLVPAGDLLEDLGAGGRLWAEEGLLLGEGELLGAALGAAEEHLCSKTKS